MFQVQILPHLILTQRAFAIGELAHAVTVVSATAIGVGRFGDTRVLEVGGDGISNGSAVRTAVYRPGVSGAGVDRQRWTLERLAPAAGVPDFSYRIRSVASGRCMRRVSDGTAVVIQDCGGSAGQRWSAPAEVNPDGFELFDGFDNRCLAIPGGSTDLGVSVNVADCTGDWSQRWQRRSGPGDCNTRDREWIHTDLCLTTEEPVVGVFASWRSTPVQISWLDPGRFVLTNSIQNFVAFDKPDFVSGLEYGWRAERSADAAGTVAYNLYWSEYNSDRLDYHVVPDSFVPGSSDPSGIDHSYLMVPAGAGDQWDLLYDYNPVTTTTLQAAGDVRSIRTGLAIRYLRSTTVGTPFENRIQLATGTSGIRRPYLREADTGEPKTCDAPPTWDDFGYGAHAPGGVDIGNRSPWCFTAAVGVQGSGSAGSAEVDFLRVGKPGAAATASTTIPGGVQPSGMVNGVDQRALAVCLRTNPNACLTTVPGLAACVAAHRSCNQAAAPRVAPSSPAVRAGATMTLAEARFAALGAVTVSDAATRAALLTQPGAVPVRRRRPPSSTRRSARGSRNRSVPSGWSPGPAGSPAWLSPPAAPTPDSPWSTTQAVVPCSTPAWAPVAPRFPDHHRHVPSDMGAYLLG